MMDNDEDDTPVRALSALAESVPHCDMEELKKEFAHSQAFSNVLERLQKEHDPLIFRLQQNYRLWTPTPEAGIDSPTRADRLFILHRIVENGEEMVEVLACMVLNYRQRGAYGSVGTHVGRTLIFVPHEFVCGRCYLMSAPYSIFVPFASAGGLEAVQTFAFSQQDSEHIRCADICVWMALDYQARHVGSQRVAIEHLRRPSFRIRHHLSPAPGLLPDEVCDIFASGGVAPVYYTLHHPTTEREEVGELLPTSDDSIPLELDVFFEVLHAYVDSQLPIVLILGRRARDTDGELLEESRLEAHSVCVVGHAAYHGAKWNGQSNTSLQIDIGTTTAFVRDLIVHDDDVGPFLRLPLRRADCRSLRPDRSLDAIWHESVESNAIGMFVGLPPEVRMSAEAALNLAKGPMGVSQNEQHSLLMLYKRLVRLQDLPDSVSALVNEFLEAHAEHRLFVSVFLELSNRLKSNIMADAHICQDTQMHYFGFPLPRYVWCVEFGSVDRYAQKEPPIFGEILIDPRFGKQTRAIVAARYPGLAFLRGENGQLQHIPAHDAPRLQWTVRNFGMLQDDESTDR